jgi:hypothetical protein
MVSDALETSSFLILSWSANADFLILSMTVAKYPAKGLIANDLIPIKLYYNWKNNISLGIPLTILPIEIF